MPARGAMELRISVRRRRTPDGVRVEMSATLPDGRTVRAWGEADYAEAEDLMTAGGYTGGFGRRFRNRMKRLTRQLASKRTVRALTRISRSPLVTSSLNLVSPGAGTALAQGARMLDKVMQLRARAEDPTGIVTEEVEERARRALDRLEERAERAETSGGGRGCVGSIPWALTGARMLRR